jgi:hypothetical protein
MEAGTREGGSRLEKGEGGRREKEGEVRRREKEGSIQEKGDADWRRMEKGERVRR